MENALLLIVIICNVIGSLQAQRYYLSNTVKIKVGNHPAHRGEVPYHVSLQVTDGDHSQEHICSGAIITKRHILTVASCFDRQPLFGYYQVVAGDYNLKSNDGTEQTRRVAKYILHPNYSSSQEEAAAYNIAILTLRVPLEFNAFVQPVSLPEKESPEDELTVSGWRTVSRSYLSRHTDVIQVMEVPLYGDIECEALQDNKGRGTLSKTSLCSRPIFEEDGVFVIEEGSPMVDIKLNIIYSIHTGFSYEYSLKLFHYIEWISSSINRDEL